MSSAREVRLLQMAEDLARLYLRDTVVRQAAMASPKLMELVQDAYKLTAPTKPPQVIQYVDEGDGIHGHVNCERDPELRSEPHDPFDRDVLRKRVGAELAKCGFHTAVLVSDDDGSCRTGPGFDHVVVEACGENLRASMNMAYTVEKHARMIAEEIAHARARRKEGPTK